MVGSDNSESGMWRVVAQMTSPSFLKITPTFSKIWHIFTAKINSRLHEASHEVVLEGDDLSGEEEVSGEAEHDVDHEGDENDDGAEGQVSGDVGIFWIGPSAENDVSGQAEGRVAAFKETTKIYRNGIILGQRFSDKLFQI